MNSDTSAEARIVLNCAKPGDRAGLVELLERFLALHFSEPCRDAADGVLAALETAGLRVVPRTPTKEIRRAFHDANEEYNHSDIGISPDDQWAAMLAVSPFAPPQQTDKP